MKFAFIRDHQGEFPVEVLCDVLEVSRSGYYAWTRRPPSPTAAASRATRRADPPGPRGEPRDLRLAARPPGPEGPGRRLLREHRGQADAGRAASVPRRGGGSSSGPPTAATTTPSPRTSWTASSIPIDRDEVWAADITYVPTAEGWLYLAVVLDLCSRRVVGWATADHLRAELACDALRMALAHRRPEGGAAAPQRPRRAVRQRRLPGPPGRARDRAEHEPHRATATTTR